MTEASRAVDASESGPARIAVGVWRGRVVRFGIAVFVAAAVVHWVTGRLPVLLPARTDVVGYPIFSPFDIGHFYAVFALWMLVFPVLATAGYFVLGLSTTRVGESDAALEQHFDAAPAADRPRWVALVAGFSALLFATVPFALAVGVVGFARDDSFRLSALGAALGAWILGGAVALVVRVRARVGLSDALWAVTAVAAPGAFVAMALLSSQTGIGITASDSFRSVMWFPWWLAVPATLAGAVAVVVILRRLPASRWSAVGGWSLVVCAVPVVLWMVLAGIQGGIGPGDLFHEGEVLVGGQLLLDGRFPWRDFLSTHGLLLDSIQSFMGFTLIEHSGWGATTAATIWAVPLYWVSSLAFAAYLFRRNRWLLVAWCALVVGGPVTGGIPLFSEHFRSLLYPLILLAMAWLVRRADPVRAALVALLLVVQVAVTPEMAYLVPALFVTLVAFDWTTHPGVAVIRRFPATLLTAMWCAIFGLAFAALLWANGALGPFIDYFRVFGEGHYLTGGIPLTGSGAVFKASVYLPPILFLIAIWYAVSRVRSKRAFEHDDWVLATVVIFGALYYTKFLARADLHSLQSFAVVTPLLWYVVARVLANADRVWWRTGTPGRALRHGVTAVAVLVVVAVVASNVRTRVDQVPLHYRTSALERSPIPRLGYTNLDPSTVSYGPTVADTRAVLAAIAPRNPKVFDFTNTPELFYFTLGLRPPTRFYHVSMAIPAAAQREVVDEIRDAKPQVVIGIGDKGLSSWDGIANMVRHYDVNRYLLTHYRPVVGVDGTVYFLRNDLPFDAASIDRLSLSQPPQFVALNESPLPCDWGAAPERFAPKPARGAKRSGPLPLTPVAASVAVTGWAADPVTGRPLASVVALGADGTVLASVVPGDSRPDVAELPGLADARHSGFRLAAPVTAGEVVTVAGRRADGTLLPLDGTFDGISTVAPGTEVRVGDADEHVDAGVGGTMEIAKRKAVPDGLRAVRMPRPGRATDWRWLSLTSARPLAPGAYNVGEPAGAGPIQFRLLADDRRSIDLMVGACNQWYSGDGGVEVLAYPAGGPVPRVELVH